MTGVAFLLPTLPFVGFVALALCGRRMSALAARRTVTTLFGLTFSASVVQWLDLLTHVGQLRHATQHLYDWMPGGAAPVSLTFLTDPLSSVMSMVIAGTGFFAMLAAALGADQDTDQRSSAWISLLLSGALVAVTADNLGIVLVGWFLCTLALHAVITTRTHDSGLGVRSFVMLYGGDMALLAAVLLLAGRFNTLIFTTDDRTGVVDLAPVLGPGFVTAVTVLLTVAAATKAAQVPTSGWLHDADRLPFPVATVVQAAIVLPLPVYLLARTGAMIDFTSATGWTVSIIGALTVAVAATSALGQGEPRAFLRLVTMVQAGVALMVAGAGGYAAAVFLVVTHALSMGVLGPLAASMHDMRPAPTTVVLWATGATALTGALPIGAFWSISQALSVLQATNVAFFTVALIGSVFVAVGVGRITTTAVRRPVRQNALRPSIAFVLGLCAAAALLVGALDVALPSFNAVLTNYLSSVVGLTPYVVADHRLFVSLLFGALVAAGFAAGAAAGRSGRWPALLHRNVLRQGWHLESAMDFAGSRGALLGAAIADGAERVVINNVPATADRLVAVVGDGARRINNGYVRAYTLSVGAGLILLFVWALIRSTT